MNTLFGTDGIRGVANVEPMTAETALAIGRATAYVCKHIDRQHRILIGKDTRLSGYMIENALTAGICSMGVDVFLVGPVPTPGIAFMTHNMRAQAGMVISASHNPYQDNGIKIFSRDGYKLSNELEKNIEELVSTGRINAIRPTADAVGKAKRIDDAVGRYIVFCKNTFPEDLTLDGYTVVIDCANGATYKVAPIIFSELGARVIPIHNRPDGMNINRDCGSQHTEDLARTVRRTHADIGLAFDGDGDRLIAVDERGRIANGDHLLYVSALAMKQAGRLPNDLVVITPMSNQGLRTAFARAGIRYLEAPVGDRNVLEIMRREGARLGGEQSGHIIFPDYHTTGDGIISALQCLAVMRRTGRPLSELTAPAPVLPQILINVPVSRKPPLEDVPAVQQAVAEAERKLAGRGRVLIRYSGTEPICRVMIEAPTRDAAAAQAEALADIVRTALAEPG
ncbi:MAG: phosphoglucosamine mutase [Lentisphaerae bacterium]|nr:phosphoglucosamine mutase [Lentisphaerota bacterium]